MSVITDVFLKLKTVKGLVLEHPSTVYMLKDPKHLWNLHESTFIKFFHHSEGNWFRKCLP